MISFREQEASMTDSRKVILNEITLWKKRFSDSKRVLTEAYKDFSKDAKKAYKVAIK
jgi:hypothetical protein